MQKKFVKYSIIFILLPVYINRGLFVTPYEAENRGSGEVNSIIEWTLQLITGESNDIDEDGDMQTDHGFTQIFLHDFPQQFVQINIFSKDIKKIDFSDKEIFLLNDFSDSIDYPPETIL